MQRGAGDSPLEFELGSFPNFKATIDSTAANEVALKKIC